MGILLITHYQRMLNYVTPDKVHVLYKGRIVRSGGSELAAELEDKGYDWITNEIDAEDEATRSRRREVRTHDDQNAGDIVTGYKYGWHDPEFKPVNVVKKGLNRDVVAQISEMKNEPQWMRDFRLRVAGDLRVQADAERASGAATSRATRSTSTTSTTT